MKRLKVAGYTHLRPVCVAVIAAVIVGIAVALPKAIEMWMTRVERLCIMYSMPPEAWNQCMAMEHDENNLIDEQWRPIPYE